ncbi:bifunctional DNA-formamidopyrimidine glycosylase/DNA-(apurinic or apyrimidinic site) lyase [soil metagenome]
MPELPEVEVVRLGLVDHVVGHTIIDAVVHDIRSVRRHLAGPHDFLAQVIGSTVVGARRRGKYLWLPLDTGDAIVVHLGMSGQMLVQAPSVAAPKHLRVSFALGDGVELRFVDQRIFGGMFVSPAGAELPAEIAHIARDPLDPEFDRDDLATRIKRRKTGIKRALLDQTLISGVGNIYADESLWRSKLHFARPTEKLRRVEIDRIVDAATDVMTEALAQGGTSFDALYVNVNGQSGYFDRSLDAYGQEGLPCSRCGTPIRRDPFMNRSSYSCPVCQPRPRHPR